MAVDKKATTNEESAQEWKYALIPMCSSNYYLIFQIKMKSPKTPSILQLHCFKALSFANKNKGSVLFIESEQIHLASSRLSAPPQRRHIYDSTAFIWCLFACVSLWLTLLPWHSESDLFALVSLFRLTFFVGARCCQHVFLSSAQMEPDPIPFLWVSIVSLAHTPNVFNCTSENSILNMFRFSLLFCLHRIRFDTLCESIDK